MWAAGYDRIVQRVNELLYSKQFLFYFIYFGVVGDGGKEILVEDTTVVS